MLKPALLEAMNRQIFEEQYSSYLYLQMSAWFEAHGLPGFANWMRVQVQEENFHMTRFFNEILHRQGEVVLGAIPAPPTSWETPLAIFEAALEHERHITSCIHALVDLARGEKDYATESFLHWFVTEQVEEEANADTVLQKLRLLGGQGPGLFMLDRELAARVFTPPVIA
jgi:ferritin